LSKRISFIKSEAIFSDDDSHRYLLSRLWDNEEQEQERKPTATVIMLNPSYANEIKYDNSSVKVMNFLVDEGYGGVTIINLFSFVETDSKKLPPYDQRYDNNTNMYIEKSVEQNQVIILAWGSNKNRIRRINFLKKILKKQKKKKTIYRLTDSDNNIKHVIYLNKLLHLEPIRKIDDI